ncbi:MAG: hypothetical protein GY696_20195 [Gammaproteobacteria bacterium]|nr:hypothetical protein [Gammaproteobacteria bacterium]
MNLLILADGRQRSSVNHNQILQLLRNLAGVQPGIAANVAIAEAQDSTAVPQILRDFSDYHGVISIPTQQPAGVRSFQELMTRIPLQTAARRVVLIMNGQDSLSDAVRRQLGGLKRQGVEIFAYQSSTDYSHPVYTQLAALSGKNGYLCRATMNGLAYALKC